MDVTLLALPEMHDRLWNVAADGHNVLQRGTLTLSERNQLAVHAALLREADLNRVLRSTRTAINEDATFTE